MGRVRIACPLLRWRLVSTGCLFMVQIQQLPQHLHVYCVFNPPVAGSQLCTPLTVCNFSSVLSGGAEAEQRWRPAADFGIFHVFSSMFADRPVSMWRKTTSEI